MRGGVGSSWVLCFNKELVPNQIMSLRTLQKAFYFTRGKSLSFNNGHEDCRIWGGGSPIGPPLTSFLPLAALPSLLFSNTMGGRRGPCLRELTLAVPPDEKALLPDID